MAFVEVSFIVVEYHCLEDILTCVDSIRNACANISYEVIVSSNSSYPSEKRGALRKKLPYVKWIFNENNRGFAGGMNSGILNASGEAIILMNPDVQISKADMRKAFDYLMSHRRVGLMGPKIIDHEGNLQDSCRKFMGPREFLSRIYKRIIWGKDVLLEPHFDYAFVQPVDWIIGAFMMVRRDALAKVGLLDQNYFIYVEDMDWCKRLWDNGFQVVYYPDIEVTYKGDRKSTSALISKKMFNKYGFYHLKSYLRFLWKNGFRFSRES